MPAITTRADLEARLRSAAAKLLARQVARAAFSGLAGAALALGLSVVFLDVLPRLLFSVSAGAAVVAGVGVVGFVVAAAVQWRRYRMPDLHDAALAMEARLKHDTGALAAALRLDESSAFFRPLLVRASDDLQMAEAAPAPVLIPTRRLVLIPMLALAAGVAFVAVLNAVPPEGRAPLAVAPQDDDRAAWADIDVGGSRSDSDRDAYRHALGMEKTAATLRDSAKTLRDANASADSKRQALEDARKSLADAEGDFEGAKATELPQNLPADAAEQAEIAKQLEAAAAGLGAKAAELKKSKGGNSEDSGESGEFKVNGAERKLVPFPAIALHPEELPAQSLAAQPPARRAMAQRAMQALERLQDR